MSKMKVLMTGSALAAAALSGSALAETTGTVNITSEYMFRGVVSEGGAAVQGSLDWSDPSGFYLGTWASNAAVAGGNELDLYGGYSFTITEGLEGDVGLVYYIFSEDQESRTPGAARPQDLDYPEIYFGLTFGGFGGKIYYTNDYFGFDGTTQTDPVSTIASRRDGEALYLSLDYTWAIKEGLDLAFHYGLSDGDGVEAAQHAGFFNGDSAFSSDEDYSDWSIALTKSLDNGFSATFAYIQTNIDANFANAAGGTGNTFDDDPKFVVTLAKGFEI